MCSVWSVRGVCAKLTTLTGHRLVGQEVEGESAGGGTPARRDHPTGHTAGVVQMEPPTPTHIQTETNTRAIHHSPQHSSSPHLNRLDHRTGSQAAPLLSTSLSPLPSSLHPRINQSTVQPTHGDQPVSQVQTRLDNPTMMAA